MKLVFLLNGYLNFSSPTIIKYASSRFLSFKYSHHLYYSRIEIFNINTEYNEFFINYFSPNLIKKC